MIGQIVKGLAQGVTKIPKAAEMVSKLAGTGSKVAKAGTAGAETVSAGSKVGNTLASLASAGDYATSNPLSQIGNVASKMASNPTIRATATKVGEGATKVGKGAAGALATGTAFHTLFDASGYDSDAGFIGNMSNVIEKTSEGSDKASALLSQGVENIKGGNVIEGLGDIGAGAWQATNNIEGLISGAITSTPIGGAIQRAESDVLGVDVGETRKTVESGLNSAKDVVKNTAPNIASAALETAGWAAGSKVYNTLMSTASGTIGSIGSVQSVTGKGSEVSGTSSTPTASLDDPSDSGSASKASAAQTAQASAAAADNTVSAPVVGAESTGAGITQSSVATGAERAASVAERSHAAGAYVGSSVDAARASGIDQRTINRERIARGREIMGLQ